MRWKKLCVYLLSACLLTSCTLLPEEETVRTAPLVRTYTRPEYQTVQVERGDLINRVKVSCNYVPVQTASLSFQLDDEYIDRYMVQAGDSVTEGQLLAQLQLGDLEARISAAENEIASLKLQIGYEQKQYDLDLQRLEITAAQLDAPEKKEAYEQAEENFVQLMQSLQDSLTYKELALKGLQKKLDQRQIRAPFSGTLTRVADFDEGDRSEFGVGVITVVDSTRSIFRASTEHWNRFTPGDRHMVTVKKEPYEAVVVSAQELGLAEPKREEGKKSYVYFALTQPSFELKDGDTGTVEIVLNERLNVLYVPAKAVTAANGKPIVYYVREDGMKAYKYVEPGMTINGYTEILNGLEEGESIIFSK